MASIRDAISGIKWMIDTISQAGRFTGYRTDGSVVPEFAVRKYYRASVAASFVAPAGTAPFFAMQGSSNRVVRIIGIKVNGMTITVSAYASIFMQKRSTAITGGTSTDLIQVPNDSADAAGTLNLCKVYTVAPTPGSLVGSVDSKRFLVADTTPTDLPAPDIEFKFDTDHEDGIILRGVSEGITLSFSTAPATGVTMDVSVVWSESDI